MKKVGIAIFCVLSLFALLLVGNVAAYNADYTHILYASDVVPTIDGTYDLGDDWVASGTQTFGANGIFRDEWTMSPNLACLLIETADSTNDAGDFWVICYDSTAEGGSTEPDGGPTPTGFDYKLVVTGHGTSATVQWYKGDTEGHGGWTAVTPDEGLCELAQSLAPYTPKIGTPHYVLELAIDKSDTSLGSYLMGYNWAQYVGYYDAHDGGYGLQEWPPTGDADVPDSWGYITYDMGLNPTPDLPEGISVVVMLMASSVVVAGAVLLRKRVKIAKFVN
jgi:hypothetical protein